MPAYFKPSHSLQIAPCCQKQCFSLLGCIQQLGILKLTLPPWEAVLINPSCSAIEMSHRTKETFLISSLLCMALVFQNWSKVQACINAAVHTWGGEKKPPRDSVSGVMTTKSKLLTELLPAVIYYKVETAAEEKPECSNANFVMYSSTTFIAPGKLHACTVRAPKGRNEKNKYCSCFKEGGYTAHISLHTTQSVWWAEHQAKAEELPSSLNKCQKQSSKWLFPLLTASKTLDIVSKLEERHRILKLVKLRIPG